MTKEIIKFQGTLGTYKAVETEDGSYTLWSEFFDENCHSTSGATEETLYNYLEGAEVVSRLSDKNGLTVFEVGLGLGIGPLLTVKEAQKRNAKLTFISTELDQGLIDWVKNNQRHEIFKTLILKEVDGLKYYESSIGEVRLIILLGDARETIKSLNKIDDFSFQAIYQDAFSPKKNRSLWTTEWFEDLRSLSASDCILSTYSSSNAMRKSLVLAGWSVENRVGFKQKRKATIAKNYGKTCTQVELSLSRSPLLPLNDEIS